MNKALSKKVTRRDFLKLGGIGFAAAAVPALMSRQSKAAGPLAGKKLAMVINLHRCVGCGACSIACKNENNVEGNVFWSSRISHTKGKFPNVRYEYITTLCNHCEKAPCVKACPTHAMHKGDGDITMHNTDKCIGCRYCIASCPYGVIHFNAGESHKFWRDDDPLIEGATPSAEEVTKKVNGRIIPFYNPDREEAKSGTGLRKRGIVEKCTLCDHRLNVGKLPYCVDACPTNARIFGDLNDPNSEVSQILGKFRAMRLKEEFGTEPKVFYVRSYNTGTHESSKGSI
jgi:molybdopterin-containing oxidoreductase family iron-sulfur binding subunit